MESNWVDFKVIKQAVTIEQVLDRYGIKLKKTGDELRGRCPIHQGEGENAFHANLIKNAFHCFSCKARGNVLDFVAAMEKCSVRDAALKLAEWFSVKAPAEIPEKPVAAEPTRAAAELVTEQVVGDCVATNKPLSFQLRGIDPTHPYLAGRGISRETAEAFGVGFFSGKGSMAGRIVIPIHNERGELVAYAGRAIDDTEPRYKLPTGFHKAVELFNLHRAREHNAERRVVVVEGFFDCMKVSAADLPSVALMGCTLSAAQEELLVRHFGTAWLMLDGDEAGQQATAEILARLGRRLWVRVADLPDGKQPDQLSREEIQALLGTT